MQINHMFKDSVNFPEFKIDESLLAKNHIIEDLNIEKE